MKKIKLSISNVTFLIGLLVGGYGVIRTIINYITLPEGVCPIENYRSYIYIGLGFTVASIIAELIFKKDKQEVE